MDARIKRGLKAEFVDGSDDVLQQAVKELTEYFQQQRQEFSLPLLLVGSAFQKQVWQSLLAIAFGQTSTYVKLAESIGHARAVRAVAGANGANAISIIVPCHRIIGSDGKLVGYAGGLSAKERLLALEMNQSFQFDR